MKNKIGLSIIILLSALAGVSPRAGAPAGYRTDAQGWREAEPGYRFSFPRDHAAHEPYRIEWWYYTGNLQSKAGRRFGFQLTFFRTGVSLEPSSESAWAVRDIYMAHFAISDIERESFHAFEKLNRGGIGWAGADSASYRVWNEDWEARLEGDDHLLGARDGGYGIELRLTPAKPVVINGENGISQKGLTVGNASHYYSITRFSSSGKLTVGGEEFEVTGQTWMDHEFGTSFLENGQVGWDWFSIQLDDGRDLMLFQLRRSDGSIDSSSSGTLVDESGRAVHIPAPEFSLIPGRAWRSGASGATYPTEWTIDLPPYGLRLKARAAFDNQELRTPESTGVTYWEGSISVEGTEGGRNISGRGYLEMTGYSGQNMGALFQ
ncbi:MAG TPA: lipocalin-like domain-containing protein [Blastocatellia bacterium]|nr:lipocalin-like domain-containing protein [Blastocatellia bacterium]